MPNPVLLNNVEHKNLRVVTTRGARYGDSVMLAITFPAEFRNLQAHYPIVFRKGGDAVSFEAVALFGFSEGENLFLAKDGWDAATLPLTIERQPFLIGISGQELMVNVDLDSPRVSSTEGEAVFLEHGGNTEFLENMTSTLLAIHEGLQSMPGFTAALLEHELLEPFVFDIELDDGSQNRLAGFYTINEERLAGLRADALGRLNEAGYLQPVFMALASLVNFRALIERKNRLHAGAR